MTNQPAITNEEAKQLQQQATVIEREVMAMTITDNASYEAMGQMNLKIKDARERVMGGDKGPIAQKKAANGVWKFLSDICNMIDAPFTRAETEADRKMGDYRREVERKRQQEIRDEQIRAEKEAAKKRQKEIDEAKALGDKEGAKNLKAAPIIPVPKPIATPEVPKIKGIPVRKVWDYQIVDENKIPRKYWTLDNVTIGKVVRALGDKHGIPGITAFQKDIQ